MKMSVKSSNLSSNSAVNKKIRKQKCIEGDFAQDLSCSERSVALSQNPQQQKNSSK